MSNFNPTVGLPPPPIFMPSTIILGPLGGNFVARTPVLLAPWIMGAFTDIFLQGILAAQVTNYFTYDDGTGKKRRFVLLVVVLQILCVLKSGQNVYIVWDYAVNNFANPDRASMLVGTAWWHYSTSLSTAVIATYVQSFFVYRYFLLTRRIYICIPIVLGMVVSLVGAILVIYYLPTFNTPVVTMWSSVHFAAAVGVDLAITLGTSHHLYTSSQRTAVRDTAEMINRLIRMTWQSALPPAIMVILNLIVLETRPFELVHISLNMVAAKLYAIALMYTLNLRNELRGERMVSTAHEITGHTHLIGKKSSHHPSASQTYRGPALAVSMNQARSKGYNSQILSTTDGIHVETQISMFATPGTNNPVELRNMRLDPGQTVPQRLSDIWDAPAGDKYRAQSRF